MTETVLGAQGLEQYLLEGGNKIADDEVLGRFLTHFRDPIRETAEQLRKWKSLPPTLWLEKLDIIINDSWFTEINNIFKADLIGHTLSKVLDLQVVGYGIDCRVPTYVFVAACHKAEVNAGIFHLGNSLHANAVLPDHNMGTSFYGYENCVANSSPEVLGRYTSNNQYTEDLLRAMQLGDLISVSKNISRQYDGKQMAVPLASMTLNVLGKKSDFLVNFGQDIAKQIAVNATLS